jgi:hypothetical protein
VVSNRMAADGKGGHGLSAFPLKTGTYRVTIHSVSSDTSIIESLSAVVQ